jgi:hypothetical protein
MSEPLDDLYLEWLYRQVRRSRSKRPSDTYWKLLRQMYTTEFVWFVPNDDNRVEDGKELRNEFCDYENIIQPDRNWMALGCSFLEMLVGLSRRLAFEAKGEPREWFWILLENLKLLGWNDVSNLPNSIVQDQLNTVIFRTYLPNGEGGLFPLRFPAEDQRRVEIWYQLMGYLLDDGDF